LARSIALIYTMILQTTTYLTIGRDIVALCPLILANVLMYYEVEIGGNTEIYKEDNFLENLQVLIIFISGFSCSLAMLIVQKGQRILPFIGALFSFSCITRELDIEKHDFPQLMILLGHGWGRKILLLSLWLSVAFVIIRNHKRYLRIALNLLATRTGLFAITGGLFLILGTLFEEQVFDVKFYVFYEELAEMNGYYFILLSSLNLFFDLQCSIKPEIFSTKSC
jgi:hypothetical protein